MYSGYSGYEPSVGSDGVGELYDALQDIESPVVKDRAREVLQNYRSLKEEVRRAEVVAREADDENENLLGLLRTFREGRHGVQGARSAELKRQIAELRDDAKGAFLGMATDLKTVQSETRDIIDEADLLRTHLTTQHSKIGEDIYQGRLDILGRALVDANSEVDDLAARVAQSEKKASDFTRVQEEAEAVLSRLKAATELSLQSAHQKLQEELTNHHKDKQSHANTLRFLLSQLAAQSSTLRGSATPPPPSVMREIDAEAASLRRDVESFVTM